MKKWLASSVLLSMTLTSPAIAEQINPPVSKQEMEETITTAQALEESSEESPDPTLQLPVFLLEQITVTGTRTPRRVSDSPANITVIDQQQLNRNVVQDIEDMVRYIPGVSVGNNLRYGFQDFNIRGLEGNRVLIQVDGIRQPERFVFGPFNLGRDYFEIETLKTVEIVRGPASSLYGSEALGGVVTYTTLAPSDLLAISGEDTYFGLTSQANSKNTGYTNTLAMAGRQERLEAMLMYTRRDFSETEIFSRNGEINNPQSGLGHNFLAKAVYRLDENSSLKLTGEYFNRVTDTTTLPFNLASGILNFDETIDTERTRISLEYEYENPDHRLFQVATARAYYQPATTSETSLDENRILRDETPVGRDTFNELVSDLVGGDLQIESNFRTGSLKHRLVLGMELNNTRNERPRDRIQTNLNTGESTREIPPDTFPTKDFPDSDTARFGIFLQDEIETEQGQLTLIPGIRYDTYDLSPKVDEAFSASGAEAVSLFADSISPKLGVVWKFSPELTAVAQYSRGFRAPQYNEVNSGFTNLTSPFFRYRTLSNPDLKPETSDSFELGLRGVFPRASFSVTGFYNTYDDFIEAFVEVGAEPSPPDSGPPGGPPPPPVILFQSQNISSARIYGVEATGSYFFNPDLRGWSIDASLAWSVGDNLTDDQPLFSINPLEAIFSLNYDDPNEKWGARLIATLVGDPRDPEREPTQLDPDQPPAIPFVPSGYTVVDLLGYYNINESYSLNFGIFNLFDTEYFRYSDVRFLNQGPEVARFAQPGTNAAINLVSRF
ncbi:MAG: TonB-dependent hemoglobin/transferrin/lactoferrin family receptor [Synechococcaceae cyanobacterium SM2_3_1]|nr:TonB-dependent hemoglobin/transferrin/lactoferrin family receptor [Synechococcaceae cyanobacterium SM2_3_1]